MNRIIRKTKPLFLFSIVLLILTTSCKEEIKKTEEVATHSEVSELLLTQIAESNLKVVAISEKAQEDQIEHATRIVLKQIENNHIQLKNKIRKIAKDNLIIIPNTLYDTTILKHFINELNIDLYLQKIKRSLHIELNLYKSIAATNQNVALQKLASETIPAIQNNISSIEKIQQPVKKSN
ncbi:MAG: hypothetical protein ABI554_03875 [Flavobacterium sp.]